MIYTVLVHGLNVETKVEANTAKEAAIDVVTGIEAIDETQIVEYEDFPFKFGFYDKILDGETEFIVEVLRNVIIKTRG